MHTRRRLKPYIVTILYGIVTISLVISLMLLTDKLLSTKKSPVSYITPSTITDDIEPVVGEQVTIIRPYLDKDVMILRNYYDNNSEEELQQKSLILYEGTYLQNSGVDYGKKDSFDVVSILDGTVANIIDDNILGKIVEIQHSNNLIASYQCLGELKVNKNDTLTQGQIIGNSGTCNISKDIGNHLHLEITNNGEIINPETIYDKSINEI